MDDSAVIIVLIVSADFVLNLKLTSYFFFALEEDVELNTHLLQVVKSRKKKEG